MGNIVAIKDLKIDERDFDRFLKVRLINPLYFRCSTLQPAFLCRNRQLEAFISPEHLASPRGFRVNRRPLLPHPL